MVFLMGTVYLDILIDFCVNVGDLSTLLLENLYLTVYIPF